MVYSTSGMTDEAIAIAYVKVDGKVSDKFLEGNEEITPFLARKKDIEFLLNNPNTNWGAKAWTICYNIVNPNPFGV
jgi:hypothetical protein